LLCIFAADDFVLYHMCFLYRCVGVLLAWRAGTTWKGGSGTWSRGTAPESYRSTDKKRTREEGRSKAVERKFGTTDERVKSTWSWGTMLVRFISYCTSSIMHYIYL